MNARARRLESGVEPRDRGRDEKGHNGRAEVEGKQKKKEIFLATYGRSEEESERERERA